MSKLKIFALTALAVAAIVVGGLATAPSASAAPKTCEQALVLSRAYIAIGDVLFAHGYSAAAAGYYGPRLGRGRSCLLGPRLRRGESKLAELPEELDA